ncbi:hypothetical protein AU184_15365 [Mycolicibacterium novocastrense]|nr:hypothetical protein AU183_00385 [Mycolicibacterium novocastrense]KUH78449.1 hypothetical protein AU072_10445 [Mycolicibacterium novocastrense]KUH79872.1 hypothetical protein AU184_15365 [Mycolicibacterium novocastrense]
MRARPVAVFVLGTQRSGTSAITRVLSLSGGALPAGLLGADAGNPRGCWEPRKAISLNEAILNRYGSAWFDPSLRLLDELADGSDARTACVAEIASYLSTLPAAPFVVIKEPRITVLFNLWFEAARDAGFDVAAVTVLRHPQEVVSSIASSWGLSPELASALWLKYNLLAERSTRGVSRVFVEYANLLEDWRREVGRVSAALGFEVEARDEGAIDEFLTPDLRRQRCGDPVTERFGTHWVSEVYEALCAAGRDGPVDMLALNRVFESYHSSERDFRRVFEDFGKHSSSLKFRLFRPPVVAAAIELAAFANGRKNTWA